jgi:hypothetical protein
MSIERKFKKRFSCATLTFSKRLREGPYKHSSRVLHRSLKVSVYNKTVNPKVLTIMTLYRLRRGSTRVSRKSIPSVIYKMRVLSFSLTSSKRMVYPTCSRSRRGERNFKDYDEPHRQVLFQLHWQHEQLRRWRKSCGAGYKQ